MKRHSARTIGLLTALALTLAACGDDEEAAPDCPEALTTCDITDAACQDIIYNFVACARGSQIGEIPPVSLMTRDMLRDFLQQDSSPESQESARLAGEALRMFNLYTPQEDFYTDAVENQVANIAAFYDPQDKRIVIIDRGFGATATEEAVIVLAHEFVHAMQDRDYDLETWESRAETLDTALSLRAVIEGEARLYEVIALIALDPTFQEAEVNWFSLYERWKSDADEALASSRSLYLDGQWIFLYVYGGNYVSQAWVQGLRSPQKIRDLFEAPPLSTLNLLIGYSNFQTPETIAPPEPFPLTLPEDHPQPYRLIDADTYGAWYLRMFLIPHLGLIQGSGGLTLEAIALSWRSDRMWIHAHEETQDVAALWIWKLRTADDASDLIDALGPTPTWSVHQEGAYVAIIASEDDDAREQWRAVAADMLADAP